MSPIIVTPAPFWSMVSRLRQFEGWRGLWRLPVAALLYALPALIFIVAAVLATFITANDFDIWTAAVGAIVVGAAGIVGRRLSWRELHRKIIEARLRTFEAQNPASEVPVLLHSKDIPAARAALMRARFNPRFYGVRLGAPPEDAPDLDHKLAVHEPDAWPQSTSDADRTRRIVVVLETAGIHARVGGVETRPGQREDHPAWKPAGPSDAPSARGSGRRAARQKRTRPADG